MTRYRIYAAVTGGKYLGVFEAETPEKAIELAEASDAASINLCWHCSSDVEDLVVHDLRAEVDD